MIALKRDFLTCLSMRVPCFFKNGTGKISRSSIARTEVQPQSSGVTRVDTQLLAISSLHPKMSSREFLSLPTASKMEHGKASFGLQGVREWVRNGPTQKHSPTRSTCCPDLIKRHSAVTAGFSCSVGQMATNCGCRPGIAGKANGPRPAPSRTSMEDLWEPRS